MGRPFKQEIQNSAKTIDWVNSQDLKDLTSDLIRYRDIPIFIVGSGGSLSACHLAAYLYQKLGVMAKAITPFELFYATQAIRNVKVLFISASGKNSDIIFAFKIAIKSEPLRLISICMKKGTKLKEVTKGYESTAKVYELDLPSGKDGFLATNSLIGYFGILLRSFGYSLLPEQFNVPESFHSELKSFVKKIDKSFSFMVIYGGCAQPIAMDIESKFVEAAIGDISHCDYRNFAHGRHHWFAKRGTSSCIIALVTPAEKNLAIKTLSILPKSIPVLYIESTHQDPIASLDLLHKSFYLVSSIGDMQKIDPGRPGVPAYGSKLYNLKYSNTLKTKVTTTDNIILRKSNCKTFEDISETEYEYWKKAYNSAQEKFNKTVFGAIVFDYDGTLCTLENRFDALKDEVTHYLIQILKSGLVVGIATGRGKSVRKELQKCIPKEYWENVIVGYYNGSDIAKIGNDRKPKVEPCNEPTLLKLHTLFQSENFALRFKSELRPFQLTIELQDSKSWTRVKPLVVQIVKAAASDGIELLESTHSIDVVKRPECSKLNLLSECAQLLSKNRLPESILCIGDKGQWPGNDYELLTHTYSLSVNEVSSDPESCWNFASAGAKNVDALLEYFQVMTITKKGLRMKFK